MARSEEQTKYEEDSGVIDMHLLQAFLLVVQFGSFWAYGLTSGTCVYHFRLDKLVHEPTEGNAWHADHIIPVYKGGGRILIKPFLFAPPVIVSES